MLSFSPYATCSSQTTAAWSLDVFAEVFLSFPIPEGAVKPLNAGKGKDYHHAKFRNQ
jgi:hypothetical protein